MAKGVDLPEKGTKGNAMAGLLEVQLSCIRKREGNITKNHLYIYLYTLAARKYRMLVLIERGKLKSVTQRGNRIVTALASCGDPY